MWVRAVSYEGPLRWHCPREDKAVCSLSGLTWGLPNTTGAHEGRYTACGVWRWSQGCSPDARGLALEQSPAALPGAPREGEALQAEQEAEPGPQMSIQGGPGLRRCSRALPRAAVHWEGRPWAPKEPAPQKHRCYSDCGSSGPWACSFFSPSIGILCESQGRQLGPPSWHCCGSYPVRHP